MQEYRADPSFGMALGPEVARDLLSHDLYYQWGHWKRQGAQKKIASSVALEPTMGLLS